MLSAGTVLRARAPVSILLAASGTLDAALAYIDNGANPCSGEQLGGGEALQAVVDLLEVSPRIRARFPVQFDLELPGVPRGTAVETENVSLSGLAIRSQRRIAVGTRLPLRLHIPTAHPPIAATAEVVRTSDQSPRGLSGFGLRFVSFQDDDANRLAVALHGLDSG